MTANKGNPEIFYESAIGYNRCRATTTVMPQHRTQIQATQAGNLLKGITDHQVNIECPLG